jgi:hypothetical protein
LSFAQKIDIILKIKELKIKDLEQEWGKSGTLYKAYEGIRYVARRAIDFL